MRAAKVPARIPPREHESALGGLDDRVAGFRLLTDAAHDEDVVVRAEGDEHDEEERGKPERDPRVAEDPLEHDHGDAHGRRVGQNDGGEQI